MTSPITNPINKARRNVITEDKVENGDDMLAAGFAKIRPSHADRQGDLSVALPCIRRESHKARGSSDYSVKELPACMG
jgi:hypothetical protein